MSSTWFPMWSSIVYSSLWDEPDYVLKIFLTMMALKDSGHVYSGTAYALSKLTHKSEQEVLEAWKILSSPDKLRQEPQEYDGRRIKAVDGGWLILNGQKYVDQVREEMRRARNRRNQMAYRIRQRAKKQATYPTAQETTAGMGTGSDDCAPPSCSNA